MAFNSALGQRNLTRIHLSRKGSKHKKGEGRLNRSFWVETGLQRFLLLESFLSSDLRPPQKILTRKPRFFVDSPQIFVSFPHASMMINGFPHSFASTFLSTVKNVSGDAFTLISTVKNEMRSL